MIVVQETTSDWAYNVPNHIYFLSNNKGKMYAFINSVTGLSKIFKNPIDFDPRHRTFEIIRKVDDNQEGIPVAGSKGDIYYVTEQGGEYKCTCTGYKYHGTCKHIEKVKNERAIG